MLLTIMMVVIMMRKEGKGRNEKDEDLVTAVKTKRMRRRIS